MYKGKIDHDFSHFGFSKNTLCMWNINSAYVMGTQLQRENLRLGTDKPYSL